MMPSSSPAAELGAETAAMRALLDVLEREQACLSAGDADGCAALLEEKARQVAALAGFAAERHRRLATLGFSADEKGMTDWLRTASEPDTAAWAELMSFTTAAHECNRVNGLLLSQLAVRNRQALDALGQRAADAGAGLYGPGGQADFTTPRGARVIG